MSMAPRETQIMDAFDRGLGAAEIAVELGLREVLVSRVLAYMRDGGEHRRFASMAARGSAQLAAAIAATGKEFS